MKQTYKSVKGVLQLLCILLIQSCVPEYPTVFSGELVDLRTDSEIPGVTLVISAYEKATLLTLPGIIRLDTLETDSQGKFHQVVPYNEQYSRFTINFLKEVTTGTFEYLNGEQDCSPYDCSSFIPGKVYQFRVKIHSDSI